MTTEMIIFILVTLVACAILYVTTWLMHKHTVTYTDGRSAVHHEGSVAPTIEYSHPSVPIVARRMYEQQKAIYRHRSKYSEVDLAEICVDGTEFYERTSQALVAHGFQILGDFEDPSLNDLLSKRIGFRILLDPSRTATAAIFQKPVSEGLSISFVELVTEFQDGSFLSTISSSNRLPDYWYPNIERHQYPETTVPEELIRLHGSACAVHSTKRQAVAPRIMSSLAQVFESQHREEEIKSQHARSVGYVNAERMKGSLGRPVLSEFEKAVVDEIQRLHHQDQRMAEATKKIQEHTSKEQV